MIVGGVARGREDERCARPGRQNRSSGKINIANKKIDFVLSK